MRFRQEAAIEHFLLAIQLVPTLPIATSNRRKAPAPVDPDSNREQARELYAGQQRANRRTRWSNSMSNVQNAGWTDF